MDAYDADTDLGDLVGVGIVLSPPRGIVEQAVRQEGWSQVMASVLLIPDS